MFKITDEELDRIKSILISEHERNTFWQPPEENLSFVDHLDNLRKFIRSWSEPFRRDQQEVPEDLRQALNTFPILILCYPNQPKQQSKLLILSASILQLEPETSSSWARIVLTKKGTRTT